MDFPTVDVVCPHVPGAVTPPAWDAIVDLAVSSSPKQVDFAVVGSQVWTLSITTDGKTPAVEGEAQTAYAAKDLRAYARALNACRASITDTEIRASLLFLNSRLNSLAETADEANPTRRKAK